MTKAEFITKVRENSELSKTQIDDVLTVILDTIVENVANGERVNFVGFGAFEKVHTEARKCVNPSTGEEITIEAKDKPKFKAGKMFADAVNGK